MQKLKRNTLINTLLLGLIGGMVLQGCYSTSGGGQDTGAAATLTASKTLSELPDFKADLPASLSDSSTSTQTALTGLSLRPQAVGDTGQYTDLSSLENIRASAWYDVQQFTGLGPVLEAFMGAIRAVASERDLEFNTVIPVGVYKVGGAIDVDFGNMVLEGTPDDMTVYIRADTEVANIDESGGTVQMPFDMHVVLEIQRDGDDYDVQLQLESVKGGRLFSSFNTTTQETMLFQICDRGVTQRQVDDIQCSSDMTQMTIAKPLADGGFGVITHYDEPLFGITRTVAWGNDNVGISESDGSGFYWSERYDGTGSLTVTDYGESIPADTSDLFKTDLAVPSTSNEIYLYFDSTLSSTGGWRISLDKTKHGGTTDPEVQGSWRSNLFVMANTSGSFAPSTDSIFQFSSVDGDFDVYKRSDVVSTPGGDYAVSTMLPLRQLRLPAGTKVEYEVTAEDGDWRAADFFVGPDDGTDIATAAYRTNNIGFTTIYTPPEAPVGPWIPNYVPVLYTAESGSSYYLPSGFQLAQDFPDPTSAEQGVDALYNVFSDAAPYVDSTFLPVGVDFDFATAGNVADLPGFDPLQ